ncbi:integrase [Bacillus cereus]|uniref:integrase n=1 Tax=Bacillus cereus TaxID=1396 RepID=UPI000BEC4A00|nr:integrase [Bacillus cereus]PEF66698.1 integrase [Bacillus cereus]
MNNNKMKAYRTYDMSFSELYELKKQLQAKVHEYGFFKFEDDTWYCEKKHVQAAHQSKFTLKFQQFDLEYKDIIKYYALLKEDSIATITQKLSSIKNFMDYLQVYFPQYKLKDVNKKMLYHFENHLKENYAIKNQMLVAYAHIKDFFETLCGVFAELPRISPTKNRNPFQSIRDKHPEKYIPTFVTKQFDRIMFDETNEIPLVLRVAYWLQRSFPNRITEVCSIETNCLKSLYDMYLLHIPSWKQNGGYVLPEIKSIPIMNSDHGRYLIDLIRKWQKQREDLLGKLPIHKKDEKYLLLAPAINFKIKHEKPHIFSHAFHYLKILELKNLYPNATFLELSNKLLEFGIEKASNSISHRMKYGLHDQYLRLRPFTSSRFNGYLSKIATIYNITDEEGKIYKPSSHQFRHNASTDRLYLGGYTIDQLRSLRNDKGENMPLHYAHQQKEMHKKMWMESTKLTSPTEAPVAFKGKIMNLNDEKKINILSKRPQMYLTWEANSKKGVGLCSMIQGCQPSGTAIHFECYECNWFIPKAEYYEDYKIEREYWMKIMEQCSKQLKRVATFENAIRNINILERILEVCENGIEKYKENIKQLNDSEGVK